MTMKYWYTIALMVLIPLISYGQGEYFTTDSLTSYGLKLIDNGDLINSSMCEVKIKDRIVQYSPYEVKEYGFKDGRVYISNEIRIADTSRRVFLERLIIGKTTLYYYRGKGIRTFYIQKDSTLFIEIPKQNNAEEDYSKQLIDLTKDCPNVLEASKLITYNRNSLSKFITRYNQCELKPFPHFKYGVLLGYEFSRLIPSDKQSENLKYFEYQDDAGFSVGILLDNPILVSDFSVHAELLFSKHGYSYHTLVDNKDLDFVANFTSLNVPILLRYSYPTNNIRPFANIGLAGKYHIKNETLIYETTFSENTIELNNAKNKDVINDFQLGYAIGGGVEFKLNCKKSLFFELRYNNLYDLGVSEFSGSSVFSVLTGINF